jgi:hypothetical protein
MEPEGSLPHSPVPIVSQINPFQAPIPLLEDSFLYYPFIYVWVSLRGLFPSDFLTKTLFAPLLSTLHATCPLHLILLALIFGEEYSLLSSSLCSLLISPVTSSLLDSSHPFLKHPQPTFFPQCWATKFQSHKKQQEKLVLYILIFIWGSKLEDTRICTRWEQALRNFQLFLISFWMEFWFFRIVCKYLNFPSISKNLLSVFV